MNKEFRNTFMDAISVEIELDNRDEDFVRGSDIKHLIADLIGSREDMGGFENPQIDLALLSVFGYD